jgi:hypothetical protein
VPRQRYESLAQVTHRQPLQGGESYALRRHRHLRAELGFVPFIVRRCPTHEEHLPCVGMDSQRQVERLFHRILVGVTGRLGNGPLGEKATENDRRMRREPRLQSPCENCGRYATCKQQVDRPVAVLADEIVFELGLPGRVGKVTVRELLRRIVQSIAQRAGEHTPIDALGRVDEGRIFRKRMK